MQSNETKINEKNDYYTTRKVKYILFIEKLIILLKTPAHINIKMKYIKQETDKMFMITTQ